jgi:hypothetical protein
MFVIVAFDEDLCICSSLLSTMGVFVFCRVPPRVCVYNSFFCQKLLTSGYEGVRRWKNKIDWFEYDIIIIPVNYFQSHWCAHNPLAHSFYSGKAGSMASVT